MLTPTSTSLYATEEGGSLLWGDAQAGSEVGEAPVPFAGRLELYGLGDGEEGRVGHGQRWAGQGHPEKHALSMLFSLKI